MGEKTGINWCDHTFNPWWGCMYQSPGCENCYAKREATRFGFSNLWGPNSIRRTFGEKHWAEPLKWNKDAELSPITRTVFCGSMCDVFESNPDIVQERGRLFRLILDTPNLQWLLLTKRASRIYHYYNWGMPESGTMIGITGESQIFLKGRLEQCREAGIRPFVSIEPMLGYISLKPEWMKGFIQWVIVGGESGPNARPIEVTWVRMIRDVCQGYGVPFFFKQWGLHVPDGQKVGQLDGQVWHQTPWGDRL